VKVDISHDLMKHVIGKKGRWFDKISKETSVNKIWFNKKRSIVEIWGPTKNLLDAHFVVQARISFIKDRFQISVIDEMETGDETKHITKTWPTDEYFELPLFGGSICFDPLSVKYLIGSEGKFFKYVTRKSGVSFVWYNTLNHSVQIWGQTEDISKAVDMISSKIKSFALV
jgi:hypothetical protein